MDSDHSERSQKQESDEQLELSVSTESLSGLVLNDTDRATNGDGSGMQVKTEGVQAHNTPAPFITHDNTASGGSSLFVIQDESLSTEHQHGRIVKTEINIAPPTHGIKRTHLDADTTPKGPRKRQRVNNNHVPKYDDQQEKATSRLAVDQPCFKATEDLATDICTIILDKASELKMSGYDDPEIDTICSMVRKFQYPAKTYPATKPVGVLGAMGSGKSTLINCLVNQDQVAEESDGSKSGTSVIQELTTADEGQTENCVSTVYYQPNKRIEQMVESHFHDIFEFQHADTSELDADEMNDLKMKCDTAIEFFTTLLCEREDFKSRSATEAYFTHANSRNDEQLLSELKRYVSEFLNSLNRVHYATILYSENMNEMNRLLMPFKGPVKTPNGYPPQPSPWPLVSKITTQLRDARILSEGAILADCPGVGDTNLTKAKAARDYITGCDTVIVANPLARIESSSQFQANLIDCIRSGKANGIIVVCTKSDDIDHSLPRKLSPSDAQTLQSLKDVAAALEEEIEDLEIRLEEEESGDENGDSRALRKDLKEKNLLLAEAKVRWKETNILIRNRETVAALQAQFRQISQSKQDLKVFCVSSRIYQAHMRGYDKTSPPDLSLEGTGILALRKFIFEIPAKRKKAALLKLCRKDLPRVLLAMEMQCSKTRLERKQDVEMKVMEPYGEFKKLMSQTKSVLKREFLSAMESSVDAHENDWKETAKQNLKAWEKYGYSSYHAICRKSGKWQVKKNGAKIGVNWNETISAIPEDDFLAAFSTFKDAFNDVKAQLSKELVLSLEKLATDLSESPELMGLDLKSFYDLIRLSMEAIEENINTSFGKLDRIVNTIRHNATSLEANDSYIIHGMQTTYDICKERKGPGVFNQLKALMSDKLTGPENIFRETMETAVEKFGKKLDEWAANAAKEIGAEFEGIITDFNRRFDNDEKEDLATRQSRQELLAEVKKVKVRMETEMKAAVEACAAYR